jgi:undecaprenyl phosphate-alpha-L-ara4FN deformylase
MSDITLAIKIDVDTERGTRLGVPAMLQLFAELDIRTTFLFSLGPDNTGRAIKRIFRPGFFKKAARTSVVSVYGIRTLMNGVLLPGPHVGRRHESIMRAARESGHEVGIHCYDHIRWQDGLASMTRAEVFAEFGKARAEFERIFGAPARTAGAAGWQANGHSLAAYDAAGLSYASDARGEYPFYPRVDGVTYRTPQIPSTLPTLDELLGRPEYPLAQLAQRYAGWLRPDRPNVWTVHAELEGMAHFGWFRDCLKQLRAAGVRFVATEDIAAKLTSVPVCDMVDGEVDGRSGTLALQRAA